ncbi:D-sedoheptulose-7-phosphate isomerase [Kitasatospora purpeofusca]|uniref:D-sedoheptulose-7-phosphate isomerase n=1 Tax=Kitasatospora purpeofusca TaxID=67352 RepID=UPI00365D4A32
MRYDEADPQPQVVRFDEFDDFDMLTKAYVDDLSECLARIPGNRVIREIAEAVWLTLAAGRDVHVAGNGGSASTSGHLMADLSLAMGACRGAERCGTVRSLADNPALLSALANDYGFDVAFARQVEQQARPGDALLMFSVSGSSPNLLRAGAAARRNGVRVFAVTGRPGELSRQASLSYHAAGTSYGRNEDVHLAVVHILSTYIHRSHQAKHAGSAGPSERSATCG